MFKVKVLTIGKCKEEWLEQALAEYEKRLKGRMAVEWLIAKDDEQLIEWVEEESYVALDPNGKLLKSEELAERMIQWGLRLNFVIGGAKGLPKEIIRKAQFVWSLSPLTFTHQITRLILIEQLYRGTEIERGSQYHK